MIQPDDTLCVCYVTYGNNDWDLTISRTLLPYSFVKQIIAMIPPNSDIGSNHVA